MQARLAQLGLGGLATSHGEILTALLARGEMQMGQLAGCIGRDPSTATALVKKLAALGYLQTRTAPHSRRAVLVSLTPQGQALEGAFSSISQQLQERYRAGIDEGELAVFRRVLSQIEENLRRAVEEE
nr:MarR family winged helix-turn-helix transcriptional regulator [Bittarella massiliensis (ex Durand et al. 2017)]